MDLVAYIILSFCHATEIIYHTLPSPDSFFFLLSASSHRILRMVDTAFLPPPLTIVESNDSEYCFMFMAGTDCTGRCRGIHVPKEQRKLCHAFVSTGECQFGTDCYYQHRLPPDMIKYHPCHLILQHPPSHSTRLISYLKDTYGDEINYYATGRQHGKGKLRNHVLLLGLQSLSSESTSNTSSSSSYNIASISSSSLSDSSVSSSSLSVHSSSPVPLLSSTAPFQPSLHPRVEAIAKDLDEADFLSIAVCRCYFVETIVYEWKDVLRYFLNKFRSIVQQRRQTSLIMSSSSSSSVTDSKEMRTIRIRGHCFPTHLSVQLAEELEFMLIEEQPVDNNVDSFVSIPRTTTNDNNAQDDINRIYAYPTMSQWEALLSVVAVDGRYYICCINNPDTHMFWTSREKHRVDTTTVCRAQYKLLEIIRRTPIFEPFLLSHISPRIAMDVGASPGGWSRVLATHPSCCYDHVYAIDPGALTDTTDNPLPSNIIHMPMKGAEAIQQLLQNDNLRNRISCYTCDMNVPTRTVLDTLKMALPLLVKDAVIIITLKNFDGDNRNWNKYVSENYNLFQTLCHKETTKLLHLISNGEAEVTIIGKYKGNL